MKRILEQVVFVAGTAITCLIILTASKLQAQTLIFETLGLQVSESVQVPNALALCAEPEIAARQGRLVVESIVNGPEKVQLLCLDDSSSVSCPVQGPEQNFHPRLIADSGMTASF